MSADPLPIPAESGAGRSFPAYVRGRARLSLVPSPVRARRAPFVALLLVLLAAGLVGLLLLNTASAQDAFRLHSLQSQQALLDQQRQTYASREDGLDDPARLAMRAAKLGLVPGGVPIFLAKGKALPQGGIRLGNLIYVPGAVPVLPPPAAVTLPPAATVKPVVKQPVVRQPAKGVVRQPVAKTPVAKTPVTAAHAPVATAPKTHTATPPTAGR